MPGSEKNHLGMFGLSVSTICDPESKIAAKHHGENCCTFRCIIRTGVIAHIHFIFTNKAVYAVFHLLVHP